MDTFDEAAAAVAAEIDSVTIIGEMVEPLEAAHHEVMDPEPSREAWLWLARQAIAYGRQNLGVSFSAMVWVDTLCSKQRDYGPSNILRFGTLGLTVRTWDKVARLANLKGRNFEASNEAAFDTVYDIVGYCMIALMLMDGTFELPLSEDEEVMV